MEPDVRKLLRQQWRVALEEIADLELQHRTWLDPQNENPHWSYIEFTCCYPDAATIRQAASQGYLSPVEVDIFSDFGQILDAYQPPTGGQYAHGAILIDPAWHAVVAAAQEALAKLSCDPTS